MASNAVDLGRGSTVTFGTSSWTAQITEISWDGIERVFESSTYLGTAIPSTGQFGGHTFIFSELADPGSMEITFHWNPDTPPPINAAAETITLTLLGPDNAAGATLAGSGAMTSLSFSGITPDGIRLGSATIKFSGLITITADS